MDYSQIALACLLVGLGWWWGRRGHTASSAQPGPAAVNMFGTVQQYVREHSPERAIMNWQRLWTHTVRVRWVQLAWWFYGRRLQQLGEPFRGRLSKYVKPTPP